MMENDLGDFFLIVEYYLRKNGLVKGNVVSFGNRSYQKIVLTPLMMDFGYMNITSDTFYQIPAQKPIVEQVTDLFNAIKKYMQFDLSVQVKPNNKITCGYIPTTKESKLFEIYPFLGLNTANYTLTEMKDQLLNKYFSEYDPNQSKFYDAMGNFDGNINNLKGNCFAGIKVYPPLGFDPWPKSSEELEKAECLYSFCCDHNIPITTHCSDGGYAVAEKPKELTNPAKWRCVLKKYENLKLNLAHMGKQGKIMWLIPRTEWRDTVLQLVNEYKSVYTDFSCAAFNDEYYKSLKKLLSEQPNNQHVRERVLFGTDFMINLLWANSYNDYLENFFKTEHFNNNEKELFCSDNPERFLFH